MSKRRKFTGVPLHSMQKCLECENLSQCQTDNNMITASAILVDCEAFYYIFRQIEDIEKRPIFNGDIDKYVKAVEYYEESHKDIPFLTPPLVANGALAVELALKFLIFKENGAFECIHNLKKLYEQLPEPHKTRLTNQIFAEAHQNSQTLDMNLSNISNLFEDYRYFFSKASVGFSGFFNDFIHIICNYALSFKSEYNNDLG